MSDLLESASEHGANASGHGSPRPDDPQSRPSRGAEPFHKGTEAQREIGPAERWSQGVKPEQTGSALRRDQEPHEVGLVKLARPETHDKVVAFFSGRAAERILDAPCGTGAVSVRLAELGHQVQASDIQEKPFAAPNIRFTQADLTQGLPFDDAEFDAAICLDGIEHMENPYAVLREFGRLVKPDGVFVVSIPNYLSIERRLKFLLTGCFPKVVTQEAFRTRYQGITAMMHISPIGYPLLKFGLEHAGFEILRLDKDRAKPRMAFLWPLALCIRLWTRLWSKKARAAYWLDETLSKAVLMGGNTLIIFCRKRALPDPLQER